MVAKPKPHVFLSHVLDMFPDWAVSVRHLAETILPEARRTPWYPVYLEPVLANVEGWPNVAMAIARRLKESGLSDWLFVLKPLDEPYAPDENPYPNFYKNERCIEFRMHVDPVLGRHNVGAMAASCSISCYRTLTQTTRSGISRCPPCHFRPSYC
jgi:hypothetical protein